MCEGSWGSLDRRQPSGEAETIMQHQIQCTEMEGQTEMRRIEEGWMGQRAERWRTTTRRRVDVSPGRNGKTLRER